MHEPLIFGLRMDGNGELRYLMKFMIVVRKVGREKNTGACKRRWAADADFFGVEGGMYRVGLFIASTGSRAHGC